MKSSNLKYKFEELIEDERFRSWVLENDAERETDWCEDKTVLPDNEKVTHFSKTFLLALENPIKNSSQIDIAAITAAVIASDKTPIFS